MEEKLSIKIVLLLLVLVGGMAFGLGAMWSKLRGLGTGSANQPAVARSKYKNLNEAFKDYAKQLGIDDKKLVSCMNSGEKKSIVDADAKEGASLGVSGTPGFFINGKFLPGAFPYESFKEIIDKELSGKGSVSNADYSDNLQKNGFVAQPKVVPLGDAPVRGDVTAQVTIVEYSDFQCPFCSQAHPTIKKVLSDYAGRVKVAYKQLPLVQLHPNAEKAAEASECARDQGKFWEFHDKLFENQSDWSGSPQV